MATGYSIHLGLNDFDYSVFGGLALFSSVNDAVDCQTLARARGFRSEDSWLLRDDEATFDRFRDVWDLVVALSRPKDTILLTWTTHGLTVGDTNQDESSGVDQAICLYDHVLIDDELFALLQKAEDRYICLIGGSCYAGGAASLAIDTMVLKTKSHNLRFDEGSKRRRARHQEVPEVPMAPVRILKPLALLPERAEAIRASQRAHIHSISTRSKRENKDELKPAGIALLAACKADQTAFDGESEYDNSIFIEGLLNVIPSSEKNIPFKQALRKVQAAVAAMLPDPELHVPALELFPEENFPDAFQKAGPFAIV